MKVPATGVVVGAAMWMASAVLAQAAQAEAIPVAVVTAAQPNSVAAQLHAIDANAVQPAQKKSQTAPPGNGERTIVVSIPDHKLALLVDGQVKAIYPVAVGKASTPSPVGRFTIVSHVAGPTYSHDGRVVAPGPGNPVGTRWMGLSERGYGIHGTNAPGSIGKSASHGCVRVGRKDLEQLFDMVAVGDAVEIHGERDAQVTAVFGAADTQQVAATQVAQSAQMAAQGGE